MDIIVDIYLLLSLTETSFKLSYTYHYVIVFMYINVYIDS